MSYVSLGVVSFSACSPVYICICVCVYKEGSAQEASSYDRSLEASGEANQGGADDNRKQQIRNAIPQVTRIATGVLPFIPSCVCAGHWESRPNKTSKFKLN